MKLSHYLWDHLHKELLFVHQLERERERGSQREREGQRAKGGEERSDIWAESHSRTREPTAGDESCSITGSP